ncbi:hypothetical protein OSB04_017960 [Centaurea solstitialis]|uniref:Uncharacterized protein n=1 Tax=Centaurea solstitialis TaxID=347529 RepID=A0AA38TFQ2_9ASTR|nr:hypothetical protein OSB04_017960 [Centaurea solstitialis]
MSRCFPYPPPGYSRNGATYEALIESIKSFYILTSLKTAICSGMCTMLPSVLNLLFWCLNKAIEAMRSQGQAERKKEKKAKKDRKEKEKRKDEEKVKLPKNPNGSQQDDACKVSQSSLGSKEAHNKRTEPNGETLEKSDLTEEHGQPIGAHKPSYSSDSTQNSNKRKRDDASVPDGSGGHGKPIKIRLLKKHKGPDSSKETLCSNSGTTDPQSVCGADAKISTWRISTSAKTNPLVPSTSNSVIEDRTRFVSGNRNTGIPATSGRENIAVQYSLNQSQTKSASGSESGLRFSSKQSRPLPSSGKPILPSVQCSLNQGQTRSASGSESGLRFSSKQSRPLPSSGKSILPSVQCSLNQSQTKSASGSESGIRFISKQSRPLPSSGKPILPSDQLKHEIPSSVLNKTALPVSSRPNKSDVDVLNPVRRQQILSHGRPVRPQNHLKHEIPPTPTVSRKNTVEGSYSGRAEQPTPSSGIPIQDKGKRSISEITAPVEEQNAEPTRYEKKLQRKHSQYEKLIRSWVPPILELQPPVDDDQDWLSRSEKSGGRSSSNRGNIETCLESAASMLWQPCARFLAEADIHALPYTVPF